VLIAAPRNWFEDEINKKYYEHFMSTYQQLANDFDIIIGRIITDEL